jgi:YgiT-type zinc finger domain-containing protein
MSDLLIKTCPICGSKRIRRVKRDVESHRGGWPFVAHGIEIEECPVCGERFFGPESLEQIDVQRPSGTKHVRRKKSA